MLLKNNEIITEKMIKDLKIEEFKKVLSFDFINVIKCLKCEKIEINKNYNIYYFKDYSILIKDNINFIDIFQSDGEIELYLNNNNNN